MREIEIQGAGRVLIPDAWTEERIKSYILELQLTPLVSNVKGWKYFGRITIDFTRHPPAVTGDMEAIVANAKDFSLKWEPVDSFWHVAPADLDKLRQVCVGVNYEIIEIKPVSPKQRHDGESATAERKGIATEGASEVATPAVVKGIIEQANPESDQKVRLSVLLKCGKVKFWMSAFDTALFPPLIAGKGKEAEVFVKVTEKGDKVFRNIVGLKRVGAVQYDTDGKTPVIQNKDREAGGRTLF